ncbi:MAG: hypothetical protein M0Z49_03595 [Chloroflexi bacterium]|nr:hypothetical protein [Chloroflexota bacterium]
MDLLAFVVLLAVVGILAITCGADSQPGDCRPWWPAIPGEDGHPQHRA